MSMSLTKTRLTIISAGQTILYQGKLTNLPIPEPIIIQKSIEFFNDPAPCMIHRSAVLNRLYTELLCTVEQATGVMSEQPFCSWDELSTEQRSWIYPTTENQPGMIRVDAR